MYNKKMIKFNEVTWYSKLCAVVFFIGVLPLLTFYIGTQYEKVKNNTDVIVEDQFAKVKNITNTVDESLKTYSNTQFGIEFQYPSDWVIKEASEIYGGKENLSIYVSNNEKNFDIRLQDHNKNQPLFSLYIIPKRDNDDRPWGMTLDAEKNFELGGIPAHIGPSEITDGGDGTGNPDFTTISAYKNDIEYQIYLAPYSGEFDNTLNRIVSTFKLSN
jgi:hypothetical protein